MQIRRFRSNIKLSSTPIKNPSKSTKKEKKKRKCIVCPLPFPKIFPNVLPKLTFPFYWIICTFFFSLPISFYIYIFFHPIQSCPYFQWSVRNLTNIKLRTSCTWIFLSKWNLHWNTLGFFSLHHFFSSWYVRIHDMLDIQIWNQHFTKFCNKVYKFEA